MAEAYVTSRGRLTIPASIRRALGLAAHDRLQLTPMPDGTVELQSKNKPDREPQSPPEPASPSKS